MEYKEAAEFAIVRLKGATAWRGADLAGVFIKNSFDFVPANNGVPKLIKIRMYDSKKKKNQWSGWTTIPELPEEFKNLCAVRAVQSLIKKVQKLKASTTTVSSPDGTGKCDDTTLFLATPGKGRVWHPMKHSTINNKFKMVFLDNVSDHSGTPLSSRYKAHSRYGGDPGDNCGACGDITAILGEYLLTPGKPRLASPDGVRHEAFVPRLQDAGPVRPLHLCEGEQRSL